MKATANKEEITQVVDTKIIVTLTMTPEEANLFFSLFEAASFETAAKKVGFDPYPIMSANNCVELNKRMDWNRAISS